MATFTKNNTNNTGAAAPEKGTPRVTRVNLVNSDKAPGLVAFANAIFEGKVFMSDIWVRENASGDAFISFLERRSKDTAISRYHQISACDKGRFSARFQSETC